MKIFVITPIYPSIYNSISSTPIVHYFTKEWVKIGHEVHVFHLCSRFPTILYWIARLFKDKISSMVGSEIPTKIPKEYNETLDGVTISHLVIKKTKPHSVISKKEENRITAFILDYCAKNGNPDYFIGHWDIPQLEILPKLKKQTKSPIALVLHNNTFELEKTHGNNVSALLQQFDALGFRNLTSKRNYFQKYGMPQKCFMAYSGVANFFLEQGKNLKKNLSKEGLRNFVFVGTLIKRKYPKLVLEALNIIYPKGGFKITFIGEGNERTAIEKVRTKGEVIFTGRIQRSEIIEYLKEADSFIMVSKGELFGLVYLEAMVLGCIPIAAKNEGIDGIVIDGNNGFLCKAGDLIDLVKTINRINAFSNEERMQISANAQKTALDFSDSKVAELYMNSLIN